MCKAPRQGGRLEVPITVMAGYVAVTEYTASSAKLGDAFDSIVFASVSGIYSPHGPQMMSIVNPVTFYFGKRRLYT